MPIPPCEQTTYRHFYPVFVTQMPGKIYYDIGSENYYPDYHDIFPKASDLQEFQRKFRPRYGNLHFCYNFYSDIPGVRSYNIALNEPLLENTGAYRSYPVPLCGGFQDLRRVIMVPNRNGTGYVPETASFFQPLAPGERDLTAEEMAAYENYFLEEEGGIGYCQLEAAKNPSRWALYWAYNKNARLFYDCAPREKERNDSSARMDMINELFVKRCRESLDVYALDQAPGMADEIGRDAGFLFTIEQQEFLEEIVAFALHFGITPQELGAISIDCANNSNVEDEFLYSLAIITSLRAAEGLNRGHMARGGEPLSPDFDLIVRTVEEAIRNGDIKIKVNNIGAQDENSLKVYGSGIMGEYLDNENKLTLQPIEAGASLFSFVNRFNNTFNFLVHECVHVYQDAIRLSANDLKTEWQAYQIDMKLRLLFLESFDGALTDAEKGEIEYFFDELDSYQVQNITSGAQCMGYNEEVLGLYEDYNDVKIDMMNELIREIGLELFDGVPSFADDVFIELYRQRHLINLMNRYVNGSHQYIADRFVESGMMESEGAICSLEISKWMEETGKKLERSRLEYMSFPLETSRGGKAATEYLAFLGYMIAYSYYLDPPMHDRLMDEYVDVFDGLSIGILYNFIDRNGM